MKQSSVELVEEALSKIESIDKNGYQLNSVIATSSTALNEAHDYDKSGEDLPLAGIPILVKDNIEARGLPASAGSLALFTNPMERDSELANRLKKAGAIIIGATNLSEWANIRSSKSTSGWSAVGGLTSNAWIHGRNAGGSSSGSGAAVSAGITQWAIGSETDGSIICPSSLNGVVGLKPSAGSVPSKGVIPISRSKDTPGPMAQTVEQVARLLAVLTNNPELHKSISSNTKFKFKVVENWRVKDGITNNIFDDIVKRISDTLGKVSTSKIDEPGEQENQDELDVLLHELSEDLDDYLLSRPEAPIKCLSDLVNFNQTHKDKEMQHFDQEFLVKSLELGGKTTEYKAKFERNYAWANNLLMKEFEDCDILLGCTFGPAWESNLSTGDSNIDATWISMAPAIAGYPIATLPMGFVDGLPVGIGIVGKKGRESEILSAMYLIEKLIDLGPLKPTFKK